MTFRLLDLNDDVLRIIGAASALVHPPHWEFPGSGQPHDWQPPPLSYKDSRTTTDFFPAKRFCLGWIYLSHVCRRMRAIIIDSPALWAEVVLAMPSSLSYGTVLSRARSVPLCLRIPASSWQNVGDETRIASAKATFAVEVLGRAAVIDFEAPDKTTGIDLAPHVNDNQYPALRYLNVPAQHLWTGHQIQILININAPNLVSLTLCGHFPVFPSPLLSLRELDIRSPRASLTADPEIFSGLVLRALSCTPALEKLSLMLERALEFAVDDSSRALELPVRLPKLRSAFISCNSYEQDPSIDAVPPPPWSYIAAPDSTTVTFGYGWCSTEVNWDSLFIAAARQLAFPTHRCIKLILSNHIDITLLGGDGEPVVRFYQESGHIPCDEILRAFPTYVNVHGIQSIDLTLQGRPLAHHPPHRAIVASLRAQNETALQPFFSAFPNVSTLAVRTDQKTTERMYQILANMTSSDDGLRAVFPSLHSLVVRYALVRVDEWLVDRNEMNLSVLSALWDGVILFLQSRAAREGATGRTVRHLVLSGAWSRDRIPGHEQEAARSAEESAMNVAATYVDNIADERIN